MFKRDLQAIQACLNIFIEEQPKHEFDSQISPKKQTVQFGNAMGKERGD